MIVRWRWYFKFIQASANDQSRAAAVNELVGEDLPGCESSYETSIVMLEALLESTSIEYDSQESSVERLDDEDRQTIEKCTLLPPQNLTSSYPKYSETSRCIAEEA